MVHFLLESNSKNQKVVRQYMNHVKIPVWLAILININIVIGSAFFMGVGKISESNGILAPFAWLLCGLMIFPLVAILARLAIHYPTAGGLYTYSKESLGNTWGFLSSWGYFIGASAGNAAVIHAFCNEFRKVQFLRAIGPVWIFNALWFELIFVLFFAFLNIFDIKVLTRVNILFTVLKAIPLVFILISLPFLFDSNNLATVQFPLHGFFETLPMLLFAFIGIEACSAITDKIEDGYKSKNVMRVFILSFLIIMAIYAILQAALICIHGPQQLNPFMTILPKLTSNPSIITIGNKILRFALMSSFLGGFYGMFYFNTWNLYTIGNEQGMLGSSYLTKVNRNAVPWICVIVQAVLVLIFLAISSNENYLITTSDMGTILAYLLSVCAFIKLFKSSLGFIALASCLVLFGICIVNLFTHGISKLLPFVALLIAGMINYMWAQKRFKK